MNLDLNLIILALGIATVLFWPKIAKLVQDNNGDGLPDFKLDAKPKSACAEKLIEASKCLDATQADIKKSLVEAAVQKMMEE